MFFYYFCSQTNIGMDEKQSIESLKAEIREKLGRSLDSPTDFDYLAVQIKEQLHEYISPTTLKRFFNYIPSDVIPRNSTLSLLARYVGKMGWKDYTPSLRSNNEESVHDNSQKLISEFSDIKKIHSSENGITAIYTAIYNGRKVVIKGLQPDYQHNDGSREKLYEEFETSFLIIHQNIVATLAYKEIEGLGECIISEYAGDETILEHIQKRRTIPEEIYPLIEQLCVAVDFLHTKGVSHNKLNCSNILVSENNCLKIIDFSESTKCTASEEDEQRDLNDLISVLETINASMSAKFKNMSSVSNRCKNSSEYSRYMSAEMIYKDISKTKSLPYTFILVASILFTAVLSSLLSYNIGQNSSHDYLYIDSMRVEHNKVTDISSSIVIYDTISKMVIRESYANCRRILHATDTIPVTKRKIINFAKNYKILLRDKEEYPRKILDKYLPISCPEHNLYMTSLVKLTEDIYQKFFSETLDSLRRIQLAEPVGNK